MQNGSPQAVVSRYNDVREVLNDRARFSSVPPAAAAKKFTKFMPSKFMTVTPPTQMEGAPHARIRRLINPSFGPGAIAAFQDQVAAMVAARIAELRAKGPAVDAMEDFATQLMPAALLGCVFQFSPEQQKAFIEMNQSLKLTAKLKPGEPFPDAYIEKFKRAEAAIQDIIATRRAHPGGDLISQMILTVDAGDSLTDQELFDLVFTFGAGALDSTASSMGGALYTLLSHPGQLREVAADLTLVPEALEECLRYHHPGFLLFTRYALVDTELNGVPLLAGMPIYVCNQAAALDPDVYPDPLRFDIRRNPANIPVFGGGIHFCVGNRLAKMVLLTALTEFLRAFPEVAFADPAFHPVYDGATSETQIVAMPIRLWAQ
jgi:cytochrome P450